MKPRLEPKTKKLNCVHTSICPRHVSVCVWARLCKSAQAACWALLNVCVCLTSSHVGISSINKQQRSDVFITEFCALAENVRGKLMHDTVHRSMHREDWTLYSVRSASTVMFLHFYIRTVNNVFHSNLNSESLLESCFHSLAAWESKVTSGAKFVTEIPHNVKITTNS